MRILSIVAFSVAAGCSTWWATAAMAADVAALTPPVARRPRVATAPTMEEKFTVNAQYRTETVRKTFTDVGRGVVRYRSGPDGRFSVQIEGTMKNPQNDENYRMRIRGEFQVRGQTIQKIDQKVEMNREARRYEALMTHNLPFVYLARFRPLPRTDEIEEATFEYEGREYKLRYLTVEKVVEATLTENGLPIGKFFLHGAFGQPPRGLLKARMTGLNNVQFSLVIDRGGGARRASAGRTE
jgi:hypothetical protein